MSGNNLKLWHGRYYITMHRFLLLSRAATIDGAFEPCCSCNLIPANIYTFAGVTQSWWNISLPNWVWSCRWPEKGSVGGSSGRWALAGCRLPPKMRTDTEVQGLICVTGEFAYKWKMTEFFCSPQLSMSSASCWPYLQPPPHPPEHCLKNIHYLWSWGTLFAINLHRRSMT